MTRKEWKSEWQQARIMRRKSFVEKSGWARPRARHANLLRLCALSRKTPADWRVYLQRAKDIRGEA